MEIKALEGLSYPIHVQYRHSIPALNAWAAGHDTRPRARLQSSFPGHGCMDDLINERCFDSKATWFINVFGLFYCFLTFCSWVCFQSATGRRPVDCGRIQMFVL